MSAAEALVAQIVEAASRHFLHSGYSRVSVEDIARSIGRSKKTLYRYFATKQALLHAVLEQVYAETGRGLAAQLGEAGGREADRLARLRRLLGVVAERLRATHQVLFADLHAAEPALGEQAWREHRRVLGRILRQLLDEAVAEGSVRADLPVEQVLELFFACVEGLPAPVAGTPESGQSTLLISLLVDGLRRR